MVYLTPKSRGDKTSLTTIVKSKIVQPKADFDKNDDITYDNAKEKYNEYFAADKWLKEHQDTDEGWNEKSTLVEKYAPAIKSKIVQPKLAIPF